MKPDVLIDGVLVSGDDASVSVFDVGYQRGFGCFEAMRAYGGVPFRAVEHLSRLESSAAALHLDLVDRETIAGWVSDRAASGGDCVVRVFVSATSFDAPPRVVVFAEPIPEVPVGLRLMPLPAPWHPAGRGTELVGAKTMSYAPNLAAMRRAVAAGYDDALLIDDDGCVLEGPTYSVGWATGGRVYTPALGQGILGSITRAAVFEVAARAGVEVEEGRFPLEQTLAADEMFVMSTVREVRPVVRVGDVEFEPGTVTEVLASGFRALVTEETA
ncbi:MAG: aminotransferase class IV [Acidimicrobiia bacterium]|nr:aminotransferase class IV [Acidimicrobiia bacterium]